VQVRPTASGHRDEGGGCPFRVVSVSSGRREKVGRGAPDCLAQGLQPL
jgi:hypothetical protein